ncbi:MAG: hypothetical protein ACRD1T_02000, partial [Acidimicrobiia bacterium]
MGLFSGRLAFDKLKVHSSIRRGGGIGSPSPSAELLSGISLAIVAAIGNTPTPSTGPAAENTTMSGLN